MFFLFEQTKALPRDQIVASKRSRLQRLPGAVCGLYRTTGHRSRLIVRWSFTVVCPIYLRQMPSLRWVWANLLP